jgi:hypothetical protein
VISWYDICAIVAPLLIADLQANPAAIGIYALIARLFLIYQEPIPLSAADLQRYDPTLSYGAARGALQRLVALRWLTDQSGHKNCYTPDHAEWDRDVPRGVRGVRRSLGRPFPPSMRGAAPAPEGPLRGALARQGGVATATSPFVVLQPSCWPWHAGNGLAGNKPKPEPFGTALAQFLRMSIMLPRLQNMTKVHRRGVRYVVWACFYTC